MSAMIYAIIAMLNVLTNTAEKVGCCYSWLQTIVEQINETLYQLNQACDDLERRNENLQRQVIKLTNAQVKVIETDGIITFRETEERNKVRAIICMKHFFNLDLSEAKKMVESGQCPRPAGDLQWMVHCMLTGCGYKIDHKTNLD